MSRGIKSGLIKSLMRKRSKDQSLEWLDARRAEKDKELRMSETGCFLWIFLVKATEKKIPTTTSTSAALHLNQFANATFTDYMPSVPPSRWARPDRWRSKT